MALPRATDVEYISTNMSGGASFGLSSTEKIAFYGATPIVKATIVQQTTITATALRTDLDAVIGALSNLGLIAYT